MGNEKIARFSDFAEEDINLSGEKMQMQDVFGKEITIKAYRLMESKVAVGKTCMQLQFELDGKERVVFTTSVVLQRQIKKYDSHLPFKTIIKNMRKYHTFT